LATVRVPTRAAVVGIVPAVESLLAAVPVVAVVVPGVRVVAGRVVEAPPRDVLEARVEVLEVVVELVAEPGTRDAAVPVVPSVLFSAVLPGLERMLVRLETVAFFSSSLALMLGRLRWLAVVDAVPGRRVAVVEVAVPGGRVGGLVRPPVGRVVVVEAVVLEAAVPAVAPGRRAEAAAVVVVPGRLRAGVVLEGPLAAVEGSGEAAAGSLVVEDAAGAESSCWTTSKLSFSDIMGGRSSNGRRAWTVCKKYACNAQFRVVRNSDTGGRWVLSVIQRDRRQGKHERANESPRAKMTMFP
jgi:hypothetical protein